MVCGEPGVPYDFVQIESAQTGNQVQCFKTCESEDFGFRDSTDSIIWIICEADTSACLRATKWVYERTGTFESFFASAEYFVDVIKFGNKDLTEAHRTCALLTSFYIIPLSMFLIWVGLMVGTLIATVGTLSMRAVIFYLQTRDDDLVLDDEITD